MSWRQPALSGPWLVSVVTHLRLYFPHMSILFRVCNVSVQLQFMDMLCKERLICNSLSNWDCLILLFWRTIFYIINPLQRTGNKLILLKICHAKHTTLNITIVLVSERDTSVSTAYIFHHNHDSTAYEKSIITLMKKRNDTRSYSVLKT